MKVRKLFPNLIGEKLSVSKGSDSMECIVAEQMITPYINRELSDKDLAIFLEHIKTCKDCYEELEIYFTIHFALLQLEKGASVPMNITQMLKEHIKASERYLLNKKYKKIAVIVMVALAQVAILFTLVTQIEIWSVGSLEATVLYRLNSGNYFQAVEHTSSEESYMILDLEEDQRTEDQRTKDQRIEDQRTKDQRTEDQRTDNKRTVDHLTEDHATEIITLEETKKKNIDHD